MRFVEAQHRVSTLKHVDRLVEQATLEDILEETKPPVPDECRYLDYPLSTPFRYCPYPNGSRFRRWMDARRLVRCRTAGTAAVEMVFYRFLFYAESPDTPFPNDAGDYTAFCVDLATPVSLDLTSGALGAEHPRWTHLTDYAPCQQLTEAAREIGAEIIKYASVRSPRQWREPCRADLQGLRGSATGRQPNLAHPNWPERCSGYPRPPEAWPRIRARYFRERSAPFGNDLGPSTRKIALVSHIRRAERSTCARAKFGSGLFSISRWIYSSQAR